MIILAKWTILFFGVYIIGAGMLMLFAPEKALAILRKAGSTNFINYAEITIRMIPAVALILYSDYSRFPEELKILGWFMLGTSVVLYIVPRRWHHAYSLKSADVLKPLYVQLLSPLAFLFGGAILYSVV